MDRPSGPSAGAAIGLFDRDGNGEGVKELLHHREGILVVLGNTETGLRDREKVIENSQGESFYKYGPGN